MPNDNQNTGPNTPTTVPSISSQDLPPMPPGQPVAPPPSSSLPPNIPPVVTQSPKKKFGGGRVIATILGILLLVGGVGAGILLTQQRQLFQQKAATNPPHCGPAYQDCSSAGSEQCQGGGYVNEDICNICPGGGSGCYCVTDDSNCTGGVGGGGGKSCDGCNGYSSPGQGMHGVISLNVNRTSPTTAALSWSYGEGRACLKRGGTYIFVGTDKAAVDNNCGLPGGSFWELNVQLPPGCKSINKVDGTVTSFNVTGLSANATYYFRAVSRFFYSECRPKHIDNCEDQGSWCGGSTWAPPSTTPTPTPPVIAQCLNVKGYSSTWTLFTDAQLSALAPGTDVNFCVAGSASSGNFDKAQFKINSTLESETTTKRPSSNDYCQSYKILPNDKTVNVKAKIHHANLGWFGENI